MSHADTDSFDPEAARQQIANYHRAMFRQFILPCTLPMAFIGLVGCALCTFVESRTYLIGPPLVAIYFAWGHVVARRNRDAWITAKENTRLLRRNYPDLLRKARDVGPWKSRAGICLAIYIVVCVAVPMAILAIIANRYLKNLQLE